MRVSAVFISLTLLSAACRNVDEPSAGGKPLSFWKKEARQVSFMSFWNSDRDERRNEAFRRLSEIGEPAVPALVELFEENRTPVSGDAFNALTNLGPRAASAVPQMRKLLTSKNKSLQRRAAWVLGTIGPAARAAVPDLVRLIQLPDPRLREIGAAALGKIGGAGHIALEGALSASDPSLREAGMSGMEARSLDLESRRRTLAQGLDDASPVVRRKAVDLLFAVKRKDVEAVTEYLLRALGDSDPQVRQAARGVLTAYFQGQRATPRFLAAILSAGDNGVRADAAWRLGGSPIPGDGAGRDPIVDDALTAALSDSEPAVRVYAARALLNADEARSVRAAMVLRRELPGLPPILRVRAAQALWNMSQRVSDVRDAYRAGLGDPEKWNRVETISAIGHMGVKGTTFVPDLERLLLDPDPEVRDRADKILYSIRAQTAAQRPPV